MIVQRNNAGLIISSNLFKVFSSIRIEGDVLNHITWYVAAIFNKSQNVRQKLWKYVENIPTTPCL